MAGHRWVSSTERYDLEGFSKLKNVLGQVSSVEMKSFEYKKRYL